MSPGLKPKRKGLAVPVIKKKPNKEDECEEQRKKDKEKKERKKLEEVMESSEAVASLYRRCEEIKNKRAGKMSLWYKGDLYRKNKDLPDIAKEINMSMMD